MSSHSTYTSLFANKTHLHFIGIGGCGMSALARIFAQRGLRVTGSDPGSNRWTQDLEKLGVTIFNKHCAENIEGVEIIIASTAIKTDNPERMAAEQAGIPIVHRSDALAEILHSRHSVAITGTHGKTTVSSWLSFILTRAGYDPTFIVGGQVPQLATNGSHGNGAYTIAEADESDGSFLRYYPRDAIVTNIEPEHMDHYGTRDNLIKSSIKFCRQVHPKGHLIICADDSGNQEVLSSLNRKVLTYSLNDTTANFAATHLEPENGGMSFDLFIDGGKVDRLHISLPGTHNVSNALAVTAWCLAERLEWESIRAALCEFTGAGRRFEIKGTWNDATLADDYAHHPTEVAATLDAARMRVGKNGGRVIAVFQPHRFSRLANHHVAFADALHAADAVCVLDVYAAGETPIDGITSELVVNRLHESGRQNTILASDLDNASEWLSQTLSPGDLALTLGAGDVWKVGETLLSQVHYAQADKKIENAPLA